MNSRQELTNEEEFPEEAEDLEQDYLSLKKTNKARKAEIRKRTKKKRDKDGEKKSHDH